MAFYEAWSGFAGKKWTEEVNVRDFIQNNYKQYEGDESFLVGPTKATDLLWGCLLGGLKLQSRPVKPMVIR